MGIPHDLDASQDISDKSRACSYRETLYHIAMSRGITLVALNRTARCHATVELQVMLRYSDTDLQLPGTSKTVN